MMVSGYFQNEKGDYTLTVNDQPVGYVKEEDHAKFFASVTGLKADLYRSNKALDAQDRLNKDYHKRFNAQLLSIYYLLGAVHDSGTHHEKQVIIMYLKMVLQKLINEYDPLPIPDDISRDLLPF